MELSQPAQYYWTSLFDRYQPQSLSFAFVPVRSLAKGEIPQLNDIAVMLEGQWLHSQEIQQWHLPALLASLLPADSPPQTSSEISAQLTSGTPVLIDPYRLGFAQHVAYSDVIPFEDSPLKGKSLMSIAGLAGAKIGLIAVGAVPAAIAHPLVLLTVPVGILLCTAAAELGPELGKGLAKLMGLAR